MPHSIAIDGPAGSGKSTAAKNLARALGLRYLDTGAMYRAVTLKALKDGIDLDDEQALLAITQAIRIRLQPQDGLTRVFVDDAEVTSEIREEEVTRQVYHVAGSEACRRVIVEMQRQFAADGGVVAEGRDIGTVVFPDAELKIFLVADTKERARRRHAELTRAGEHVDFDKVLRNIEVRDQRDSDRKVSPLRKAFGAVVVDTTHNSVDQTLAKLIEVAGRHLPELKAAKS